MDAFHWIDSLGTGIDEVDSQHKGLLELLNRLANTEANATPEAEIADIVAALARYARDHFDLEVRMMQSADCDLRHVVMHVHEHEDFMRHVSFAGEGLDAGEARVGHELASYLAQWLWRHIMGVDQVMAAQLQLIESGVSGAEAYARVVLAKSVAA
jgi:hemerythrin